MKFSNNHYLTQKKLTQAKWIATGLLLIATCLFIFSLIFVEKYSFLKYIKAFSEAAMIGALADWFAVVALFRHPLGVPIPHTAILPKSKNKMAKQLGHFIESNFLQSYIISKRILEHKPTQSFLEWLQKENNEEKIAKIIAKQFSSMVNTLKPEWLSSFILQLVNQKLTGKEISHFFVTVLNLLKQNNYDDRLITHFIKQLAQWLANEETRSLMEHSLNNWVKSIEKEEPKKWDKFLAILKGSAFDLVDGWIVDKFLDWAENYCQSALKDSNHSFRIILKEKINELIDYLTNSDFAHHKMDSFKNEIVQYPSPTEFLTDTLHTLQVWSEQDSKKDHSYIATQIQQIIQYFYKEFISNLKMLHLVDIKIILFSKDILNQYKSSIARYIEDQVISWDSHDLVEKLELAVGKDLQFIRINGTIVGGLVGLLICIITEWLL